MGEIGGILALFLPLIVIFVLANLGERARREGDAASPFAVFAYIILIGLYAALLALGAIFAFIQALPQVSQFLEENPALSFSSSPVFTLGFVVPSILGLILLLPQVRRLVARLLPIDPANHVHTVALSMSMLVFINMMVTLGVGLDTISEMVSAAEQESGQSAISFAGVWLQQIAMALLGVIGVGWIVRRSWSESMERLGLVVPTMRQVLLGLGIAFVLVSAVIAVQAVASMFGFGENADVEKLTEQLLGPLFSSPLGILTLGLSAALGEETLMRGAAQPRLGLLYTSFLFALLHSNYGITFSTWIVFGVGIVLGLVRIYFNTSTSMVVHATYNMLLGLMAVLGLEYLQGGK